MVSTREAEVTVAPAGKFPAISNIRRPRLLPPFLRPPATKVVPPPRLLSGKACWREVSAMGRRLAVSARVTVLRAKNAIIKAENRGFTRHMRG
jgi:hypothetical protein